MARAEKKSLFITGAAGFVGKRLLQRLVPANYRQIYCLSRKENPFLTALAAENENITVIHADLFEAERYRDELANADIAVHLAAVTGKAKKEHYFRVNTEGTAFFIEECKKAHIRGLLHFSTIAVHFKDLSVYPYARSKQAAEEIVRGSGLKHTIVRPTIIFGVQSPIWRNFLTMSRAPVPFVFGNGRNRIQPIHVDDLVDAVLGMIDEEHFEDAAYDLGGADVVTINELLLKIREKISAQSARTVFHVPLFPLSFILKRLEPFVLSMLPFTAGQLTSFSSDGVAETNALMVAIRPRLRSLDNILTDLIRQSEAEAAREDLAAEGVRLGRQLAGSDPPGMVLEKYIEAHRQGLIKPDLIRGRFERMVLGIAKIGPLFYPAQAYSAVFHRTGLLWKKMVLLTAILECMPNTAAAFDEPESGSLLGF
jgi:nucleoside-diphosphate-sugar epimerase